MKFLNSAATLMLLGTFHLHGKVVIAEPRSLRRPDGTTRRRTQSAISTGHEGCPCIDESNVLSSLSERSCQTTGGSPGVMLTAEGPCVPYSYGSNQCLQHDFIHDPKCLVSADGGTNIPEYCFRPFCYVDAKTCMQLSDDRVFRSAYFPHDTGVDVFYSYETCDSSYLFEQNANGVLGGVTIEAAVPTYADPLHYKRDAAGVILHDAGPELYNNSAPYEGVLIDFLNSLQLESKEDFNVAYTFGSRSSRLIHPTSSYTSVVQDIHDGLVDMGVGYFWVTGERLKLSSFTVPISFDMTVLVIPKPAVKDSLSAQTSKVLAPFTTGVWMLILGLIMFTAALSVWFADVEEKQLGKRKPKETKKIVYARLGVDEFLSKGMFFNSAGVEQDVGASLPLKMLLFGFSFFTLIVVSAYVANLAAFLTQSLPDFIGTMEEAVEAGVAICAHPVLKTQLEIAWPRANFVFSNEGKEFYGMLDDYDDGKCQVMAVGKMDTTNDLELMNKFCERNLVFTESLVGEQAVAFPIKTELASAMSYHILEGEKFKGITIPAAQEKYDQEFKRQPDCNIEFSLLDQEPSDYAKIGVENLFFPTIFFCSFAFAAVLCQLYDQWSYKKSLKKGKKTFSTIMGRSTSLRVKKDLKVDMAEKTDSLKSWNREVNDGNATAQLQSLMETGALDKILTLLKNIKEEKDQRADSPQ